MSATSAADNGQGAWPLPGGRTRFRVWAPRPRRIELELPDAGVRVPLERNGERFAEVEIDAAPGALYRYRLEGERLRPDPAARSLPHGVHGPAEVWDPAFPWRDHGFCPPPLRDWVLYELHVGTFSPRGDFAGVEAALPDLRELGVSAIELMPVAPFPGRRNWGYDGVAPYAVQASYGGPRGLQRLVDAAHRAGLAVVLDAVYNHLGPEGSYLAEFGPYFTDRRQTPWGAAVNYDGRDSGPVRRFFLDAALRWFDAFHLDALRLDAIHGIFDQSTPHVLAQLQDEVKAQAERIGRRAWVIAESDLGEAQVIRGRSEGGWGLDAQWNDDFHHALHARLTGETQGYYVDFGQTTPIATALRQGYVYTGQPSRFRGRRFGTSTEGIPPERFVVYSQNHDQVGNRALGERLSQLVSPARARLAAAMTLLAPNVPLLFMGEEYAEPAPFLYFTDHGDPDLARAVSRGRREEFPFLAGATVPDPQAEETFLTSRIDRELRRKGRHAQIYALYRDLIALRRRHPSLRCAPARVEEEGEVLRVERQAEGERSLVFFSLADEPIELRVEPPFARVFDSGWDGYGGSTPDLEDGPLQPWSARVYVLRD